MATGILQAVALRQQTLDPSARSRLRRSFLVYTGLVLLLGWAYAVWYIAAEHERAIRIARNQLSIASAALTVAVEAMLGDGLGAAEAAFLHLQHAGGLESNWQRVPEQLGQDLTGAEYVRALFLADATHTVVVGRGDYRLDVEGRPAWLANARSFGAIRVGTSTRSPADPTRHFVPIAAAKTDRSGQAVWVGFWLGVEELNERHSRLRIRESVISLLRLDGAAVIYTTNRGEQPDAAALERIRTSALLTRIRNSRLPAVFDGISSVDGARKLFAVSRINNDIPLFISVSRDVDSILVGWERSTIRIIGLALGSSLVLLLLTALICRFMSEINHREMQFQQLFENSLASILMIKNGSVVAHNDTAARVFRTGTLRELTPADLSPAQQPDGTRSQEELTRREAGLRERGAMTFRWLFKRLDDGSPFEAEVNLSTIQIAYDTITLAIVHDISELERARRALQEANTNLESRVAQRTRELQDANARLAAANRELEQFSASASHDLRSPLATISGQAGMLELEIGDALGAKAAERLGRIHAAVKRASDVVDGLLALARIARQDLLRERVSLSAIAEQVIGELEQEEPTRDVVYRIEPDMWVNADARLMHSLLANLLTNAWKYSCDKPQTSIEVARHLEDGQVVYSVRDNGIGFDMAHAAKIFQAFERLPGREKFTGVGLGLAIAASVVARYGGRMWARGQEGHGATFYFTLPAAHDAADDG